MEWFKVPLLPFKNLKNEMKKVVKLLEKGPKDIHLKSKYYYEVLNHVHENEITKRVSETKNYNERVEQLAKLGMLHYTKKQFEELTKYCKIRANQVTDEIYRIEQQYIEPTHVHYGPISYQKRTYQVGGEEYTTYNGTIQYNGPFFAAVLALVVSGFFFG